jgi:hypothetical protein
LPGLAESRKALADARGELERQRKASARALSVVAKGEQLTALIERTIDARLDAIERPALCRPELVLDIWN